MISITVYTNDLDKVLVERNAVIFEKESDTSLNPIYN